jgi:hypothetical protein
MAQGFKIETVRSNRRQIETAMKRLADQRVMVGIPKVASPRNDGPITNAEIGYVQEHGNPETNLPARPHLRPTAEANKPLMVRLLKAAGQAAFHGDTSKADARLNQLGLALAAKVKLFIRDGIAPDLSERTVEARIRRRQTGRKKRRALVAANVAAGKAPGEGIFIPLIDTGDYMAHITYVVRGGKGKGADQQVGPIQDGTP